MSEDSISGRPDTSSLVTFVVVYTLHTFCLISSCSCLFVPNQSRTNFVLSCHKVFRTITICQHILYLIFQNHTRSSRGRGCIWHSSLYCNWYVKIRTAHPEGGSAFGKLGGYRYQKESCPLGPSLTRVNNAIERLIEEWGKSEKAQTDRRGMVIRARCLSLSYRCPLMGSGMTRESTPVQI